MPVRRSQPYVETSNANKNAAKGIIKYVYSTNIVDLNQFMKLMPTNLVDYINSTLSLPRYAHPACYSTTTCLPKT